MNLLRKPSCGARLCLRRRGRLANRRPLRHPRLAASATGGASAAMPDTLRAPRLHPQSLRKKRDKQTLVSLFWQGQKDLNPRHAVLEWMWNQHTRSRRGAVLPGSFRKSEKRVVLVWCCGEIWLGPSSGQIATGTIWHSSRIFWISTADSSFFSARVTASFSKKSQLADRISFALR